ncbi:MAG: hypothetical protein ABIK92_02250, partial [Pseudomonadota bacterium]
MRYLAIYNIDVPNIAFILKPELIQALRASFKTPHFGRSLRWAQISILEILNVFLWLKFSPALSLTKLKRFESG